MSRADRPCVLITGACRGVGRACAEQLSARGAELVLADHDAAALTEIAQQLDAVGRYCDVASEASVTIFAADVLNRYPEIDMVINAAGGGYERTLGMYRVSRALLPALRKGRLQNILLNVPPSADDRAPIFPYASSQQAFHRLSAALAAETRGSSVRVLIGWPHTGHIAQVLPDRNAGAVAETSDLTRYANDVSGGLAAYIADLLDGDCSSRNVA